MPKGTPRLNPCKHGKPVALVRADDHWRVANDCCESVIHWNRHILARSWNRLVHPTTGDNTHVH